MEENLSSQQACAVRDAETRGPQEFDASADNPTELLAQTGLEEREC